MPKLQAVNKKLPAVIVKRHITKRTQFHSLATCNTNGEVAERNL